MVRIPTPSEAYNLLESTLLDRYGIRTVGNGNESRLL